MGQSLGSLVVPPGSAPAEIAIQVWNGVPYGYLGWFVYIDGQLIGWYPISTSQPAPPTSTFAAPMLYTAQYVQVGGEVFDNWPNGQHTTTAMGSGIVPACGYRYAAYHRNISYIDGANAYHDVTMSAVNEPTSEGDAGRYGICGFNAGTFNAGIGYSLSFDPKLTRGATNWGSEFFYGGSALTNCPTP